MLPIVVRRPVLGQRSLPAPEVDVAHWHRPRANAAAKVGGSGQFFTQQSLHHVHVCHAFRFFHHQPLDALQGTGVALAEVGDRLWIVGDALPHERRKSDSEISRMPNSAIAWVAVVPDSTIF